MDDSNIYSKGLSEILERMDWFVCSRGVPNNAISFNPIKFSLEQKILVVSRQAFIERQFVEDQLSLKAFLETTSMFCSRENLIGLKVIQQNEKSTQNAISALMLADFFLLYLFRDGLVWLMTDIPCSASQLLPSNNPIISKLNHYFYFQNSPTYKQFDPWDAEHY